MIKNLPKQFPIAALEAFEFGDADAQLDPLLLHCPVPTSAIADVLSDKKDIVLGYRGAGKSALVRLITEGRLSFKKEEKWEPFVLCLDEEFSFQLISGALARGALEQRERKLICRVIWEILLIYRAFTEIKNRFELTDKTVASYLEELDSALGFPGKKPGLVEVLVTSKKKIGVKFDTNLPSIVDMYVGWEPPTPTSSPEESPVTLKLIDYKRYLNRFLHERGKTLYVLFDRLDDFVAREEYEVQRHLLHGLLAMQADYRQKYPRVRIKAFIRSDLFMKLDLSELGPDKLLARSVSLSWSAADIKLFVAKRIALNLMQALKLPLLHIEMDRNECAVTRDELATLHETRDRLRSNSVWSWRFWKSLMWLRRLKKRGADEGRLRNSSEVVNEAIITSILPTVVPHLNANGVQASSGLLEYFETHFQFGHGETTPRAMLSFLNHFLNGVRHYYAQNPDLQTVEKNGNGEYPLFVKKAVQPAYEAHRRECWDVQYNWATPWKSLMGTAQRLSRTRKFSFADFVKAAKVEDDDVRQFLAFCSHTGLVRCTNERERYDLREYEFPVLFHTVGESKPRR